MRKRLHARYLYRKGSESKRSDTFHEVAQSQQSSVMLAHECDAVLSYSSLCAAADNVSNTVSKIPRYDRIRRNAVQFKFQHAERNGERQVRVR